MSGVVTFEEEVEAEGVEGSRLAAPKACCKRDVDASLEAFRSYFPLIKRVGVLGEAEVSTCRS